MKKPIARPASLPCPWDELLLPPHEVSLLKAIPVEAMAVIEKICGGGRNPFAPGGEDGRRATDFACGKVWVAGTIKMARAARLPSQSRGAPADLPNSPTPAPKTDQQ